MRSFAALLLLGVCIACGRHEQKPTATDAPKPPSVPVTRGIATPLRIDVSSFTQTDRIDVGDEADEKAHEYSIDKATYVGTFKFEPTPETAYEENGRATKSFESFRVKVTPGEDHVLIRAFDTLPKSQKVKVTVNGKEAGEWALPDRTDNRYGEAAFTLPKTLLGSQPTATIRLDYAGGLPDVNAYVYWVFAKAARGIETPISTDLTGLELRDRIDVGDEQDEAAHDYKIDSPTYSGSRQFNWPATGAAYVETGRSTKSFETFRMKVTPGKDHVLVKAFDTLSKDQKLLVTVDGKRVGDWLLPNGTERLGEASFPIPKSAIGDRLDVGIRIDFVSGSIDASTLAYWLYARVAVSGIERPLKIDTAGLTLIDRIDVGSEADEKTHEYSIDKPTYFGTRQIDAGAAGQYVDTVRSNKSFEAFRAKVKPGVDNYLVKAFDPLSKDQKVRVLVNEQLVSEWALPKTPAAERYAEAKLKIPARIIGTQDSASFKIEFVSASLDTNSFAYWIFASGN